MTIVLLSIIILLSVALVTVVMQKQQPVKDTKPKGDELTSRYIITRLTQQNFIKAVNIVMDLVQTEGADIEVIYDNQVIFNCYIDIDENGNNRPHFYYNKKVLDANGIIYK